LQHEREKQPTMTFDAKASGEVNDPFGEERAAISKLMQRRALSVRDV
jgi:hypothetical protein